MCFTVIKPLQCNVTGHRLYAPHTGCNTGFRGNLQQPDITGVLYMGAATQLNRKVTDRQYAHLVTVLLTEQGHGTRLHGIIHGHNPGFCNGISTNLLIDEVFNIGKLLRCHRFIMREIESQPFGVNQRPLLLYMVSEHSTQSGMQ